MGGPSTILRRLTRLATGAALALMLPAGLSAAQTLYTYSDAPASYPTVSETAASCSAPLVRTFSVSQSYIVQDIDVGVLIAHSYRGDVVLTLEAPSGASVTFVTGSSTLGADNINVRFSDEAASGYTSNTGNHSTYSPYQYTLRPQTALSALDGESSQGTWKLKICDQYGGDSGNYRRADLYITGTTSVADLALSASASTTSPNYGDNVDLTFTVTHETGTLTATGVAVSIPLPTGLTYVSSTGSGSFNSSTGQWSVGTVAPGNVISRTVTVQVQSSGLYNFLAEISASSATDLDSTPNNASTDPFEDDTASVSLTPGYSGTPGVAPNLSCSVPDKFDWDTHAWTYSSTVLSKSYPGGGTDGTDFSFAFAGDTSYRVSPSPSTTTDNTGGLSPVQASLFYYQNLTSPSQSVSLTVTVGTSGTGVQDFQLSVFDVDYAAGQFRDEIAVTGFLGGAAVSPILTPGAANSVIGNIAYGTAGADGTDAAGTVVITFLSPVDTVVITYSNPLASTGLSDQALSFHDVFYCPRQRDFGDIPTSYGTPYHLINAGYHIGATVPDGESATQVTANASGDDTTGTDDEDTIALTNFVQGISTSFNVSVTGSGAYLQAWIDWNADGDFNDTVDGQSERVGTDLQTAGATGTITIPVTVPASAPAGNTVMRLRWSSQSGLSSTGSAPDGEVEDHLVIIGGAATLAGVKTMSIYDPNGLGLYALPGNDVLYTITVSNTGAGPADTDSVFLADRIPDQVDFWNGDVDSGGPDTHAGIDPVGFSQANGASLSFDYATDVAFSTSATAPTTFGDCTAEVVDDTYRPDLTFICFNPKGAMAAGDPDPSFSVTFRGRIR
ncbi:MAG: GEVED domain-containing protein [Hyphomonas sp.]|uniref:GEVED domain-containing protein n=1 Tax=Hyphomonas sp. TaxID=87 RepID=UPI003528A424